MKSSPKNLYNLIRLSGVIFVKMNFDFLFGHKWLVVISHFGLLLHFIEVWVCFWG